MGDAAAAAAVTWLCHPTLAQPRSSANKKMIFGLAEDEALFGSQHNRSKLKGTIIDGGMRTSEKYYRVKNTKIT